MEMPITQIVLIVLILLLLVAYPILITRKNRKAEERLQQQTNSLKKGDEILTTSGVYGKIVEVIQDGAETKVVIETGNSKNTSYMTIVAYSIYTVFHKESDVAKSEKSDEEKSCEKSTKK